MSTLNGAFVSNNLALIADGDNNGDGTLTISDNITVPGDLRIEGHEIIALDSLSAPTVASISASRILISVDTSTQFITNTDELDIELDAESRTANQMIQIENGGDLSLVDLNCDDHSILSTSDDVRITTTDSLLIQEQIVLDAGTLVIGAGSSINQLSNGTITADALAINGSTLTTLDADNDVNTFASNHNGLLVFNDVDELGIATVTFASGTPIELMSMGIIGNGADTKILTAGDLTIEQAIDSSGGTVFLNANGRVTQSVQGTITASDLGIMTGSATILDAANAIDNFAGQSNDLLIFNKTSLFVIKFYTNRKRLNRHRLGV